MSQPERLPSVMPGLFIYVGPVYWGQVIERVGENYWLVLDPNEAGFTVVPTSDLRSAKLYREKIGAN